MSQESSLLSLLKKRFADDVLETHSFKGDDTAVVKKDKILDVLQFLRDDPGTFFDFLMDVTAVDWLGKEPRFEVVYHLYSSKNNHRIRVKTHVPEENAEIETATGIWKGANWFEREVWDMYGIRIKGHPDLRRILMYDGFEGHPLRKDYQKDLRQPTVLSLDFPDPRKDVRRVIKATDLMRGGEPEQIQGESGKEE
ncbi:MAG: NADH-quinone oxidoreductase subunit C [Deltaproteobacteria bacterium]|nr:NADH-quinone oxidoreductase subunit C [Deltaproteobacteria bacterium]